MKSFNRRDILRFGAAGLGSLLVPVGMRKIASAAETAAPDTAASAKTKGKILPPPQGCYVGFYTAWIFEAFKAMVPLRSAIQAAGNLDDAYKIEEPVFAKQEAQLVATIRAEAEAYVKAIGGKPYIWGNREYAKVWKPFPTGISKGIAELGMVPLQYAVLETTIERLTPQLGDIVNGKYDRHIQRYAQGARAFGQRYGGFFVTTMHEPNARKNVPGIRMFSGQKEFTPDLFKKTWQHIWQVFRDEGANEYATWMLQYRARDPLGDSYYYPGDEYVDWIGLSVQNWWILHSKYKDYYGYLNDIISERYEEMAQVHKDKPIMLPEISITSGSDQPKWLADAFRTIKSKPKIGAAVLWDVPRTPLNYENEDWSITTSAKDQLKEIFKDPYWILAR